MPSSDANTALSTEAATQWGMLVKKIELSGLPLLQNDLAVICPVSTSCRTPSKSVCKLSRLAYFRDKDAHVLCRSYEKDLLQLERVQSVCTGVEEAHSVNERIWICVRIYECIGKVRPLEGVAVQRLSEEKAQMVQRTELKRCTDRNPHRLLVPSHLSSN